MQKLQGYSEDEKRKAAYALNLCAVSVSQIIDYNDVYVLEQEYDAILNNLNLEAMPKDEALLNILVELLNTITFFRIQEKKKEKVEKDYQRRMKNAIWAAVPNLSVIAVGNPIALALSVATQVGTGYMNYRREKASAKAEKENTEFELEITAMEQFHALRRELFTTAWRLADAYGFKDEWRLTENQIKQYDWILMDADMYRKYARMEAIASNFEAYPPFWYFYAHTALYISENETDAMAKAEYLARAKQHFERYYQLNRFSLLREDQLAASALLEYADLLLLESATENREKVYGLIREAQKKAGLAKDVLQLCAVSYLKIGKTQDAASLLKFLVNEEYNTAMNAKILSRIYVSQYLATESPAAYADYRVLSQRVAPEWLFPMPRGNASDQAMEDAFVKTQKLDLIKAYRSSLQDYAYKSMHAYENALQDIWQEDASAEECTRLLSGLRAGEYSKICMDQLNAMLTGLDTLPAFQNLESRERLIRLLAGMLRNSKAPLQALQEKNVETFAPADRQELETVFSFERLTELFFDKLKTRIMEQITTAQTLGELNLLESDLIQFCKEQQLPEPRYLGLRQNDTKPEKAEKYQYFDAQLLGDVSDAEKQKKMADSMQSVVKAAGEQLIKDPERAALYLKGEPNFDAYFANTNLGAEKYMVKQKAVAVLDDMTKEDYDLILTVNGVIVIRKNEILEKGEKTVRYDAIKLVTSGKQSSLKIWYPHEYENDAVDLKALHSLFQALDAQMKTV